MEAYVNQIILLKERLNRALKNEIMDEDICEDDWEAGLHYGKKVITEESIMALDEILKGTYK